MWTGCCKTFLLVLWRSIHWTHGTIGKKEIQKRNAVQYWRCSRCVLSQKHLSCCSVPCDMVSCLHSMGSAWFYYDWSLSRKKSSHHEHSLLVKGFSIFEIALCCSRPVQCLFIMATFHQPLQWLSQKKVLAIWKKWMSVNKLSLLVSFFLSHTHTGIRTLEWWQSVCVWLCVTSAVRQTCLCGCETLE